MTRYTKEQARAIKPTTYAYTMPSGGAHIVRAYLKENAVERLRQHYPEQQITDADVYKSNTVVSDCCDMMVRVNTYWDADLQDYKDEFSFLLKEMADQYL